MKLELCLVKKKITNETKSYPRWAADMREFDVAIGTVETLAPGTDATASITGDVPDKALNLGIPVGATGAQGPQGDPGPNTVSTETATDLTGLIAGDGTNIRAATAADGDALPVTGGTLGDSCRLLIRNWRKLLTTFRKRSQILKGLPWDPCRTKVLRALN